MEKRLITGLFLCILLAVSSAEATILPVKARTETIEDFKSYPDTAALKKAWTFDPYLGVPQIITSYALISEKGNTYLEIKANMAEKPYYAVLQRQFSLVRNWSKYSRITIDHRRGFGASKEQLLLEILDASDWSHKWQSVSWTSPEGKDWHTQTIDISGCPWLKKVGAIRIVIKAQDYGMTTADIGNIQLK